jgi:outer membrane protein TolC
MRDEGRTAAVLVVALVLPACGIVRQFTRAEGDGGWSAVRRAEEVERIADRAGVAYAGAAVAPAPDRPLDLPAALDLAAVRNLSIREAGAELDAARQRVWEARGRLLPAATGSGQYTWYTDALTNQIPAGAFPGGATPSFVIREDEVGTLNGTVTVPLDLTGEITHTLRAAQAGYRGERARLWATTLAQEVAVVRAYFGLLEAQQLLEVTEQTLLVQRQQLKDAESRFGSGRLTKNELLVVQVALRNAEQERIRRVLAIDRARWTLNRTIGVAVDAPTAIVEVRAPPSVPAVGDALRSAYAHNPAIEALLEEQQRLEATARSLARGRLPRLSGGGAIDYTTNDILEPQEMGSGFVGFSWDLGTDTRREARIAEARIAADRNRIEIERELRELEAAVRETQRSAEERLAALATAATAVGQAEENLRIRQQQFGAGRAATDDVLDAEAILAQQRAALATALYQAHTRRAELQQLMGLPLGATPEAN